MSEDSSHHTSRMRHHEHGNRATEDDGSQVTPADIREKLEELSERAAALAGGGGAAWVVGALLGAAAVVGAAYLAGRRACR